MADANKVDTIEDEIRALARSLEKVIKKLFFDRREIRFHATSIKREVIVEFMQRMRVFGMEKFDKAACVSMVNFYVNERDKAKQNAFGTLLIYVPEELVLLVLGFLKIPIDIKIESEEDILKLSSRVGEAIVAEFKKELPALGYKNLFISEIVNFRNSTTHGVPFYRTIRAKDDVSFILDPEEGKILAVDITMGPKSAIK